MPDEESRVYERFQLIVNGPALFQAVASALELDLFRYLSPSIRGPPRTVRTAGGTFSLAGSASTTPRSRT